MRLMCYSDFFCVCMHEYIPVRIHIYRLLCASPCSGQLVWETYHTTAGVLTAFCCSSQKQM